MLLERVQIPSPNYSGRGGSRVRLIVLHTAEGATTYQSLGAYFASPSSGVSSHVGIDDTPNTVGEYVNRTQKAWTQGNANPVAVSAELCGFAAWTTGDWDDHPEMLANAAQWLAEEAAYFGIPLQILSAGEAQGSGVGICQHNDLGAWGGGHWDCGPGFPIDRVVEMARQGGSAPVPSPSPPHPNEEDLVPLTSMVDKDGNNLIYGVDDNGDLWEITTKPADPHTPMTKTYRWSNITANGQNGHKLAKT